MMGMMIRLKTEHRTLERDGRKMKMILLRPEHADKRVPGILWIHGGGYATGMASMVQLSMGKVLAKRYGAVVLSPGYTLSWKKPYPAALEDCYAALEYLYDHAEELGVDKGRIIVGGESAGGGLFAAVCLYARDKGKIPVSFQIPLYPMLDCFDTGSSRDNHAHVWNTKRNHQAWALYLKGVERNHVPYYASPSRAEDLSSMPPCYTYVEDGEPFYEETLTYVRKLNEAGIPARVDVFRGNTHGFDLFFFTKNAREAKKKLLENTEHLFR